mmetsp:Transcript_15955/g.20975  ORF Transcript_15955/g.20975 Transcript_15955/m.20975 type:complete len:241 (-) Transcript_15955:239-961(-)|eukprot:CAMPEP_0197295926 /NCGR_PEP_ID=MMETSP0890-20130614/37003_1 /TAXON_ID=44058 ORGANISM="Aureoumbra lagunensis, Strain CCMP1510" /NCGR_SAMPLE_ID=MMETSP0890 /ASSEMBLY_ACC=CAM_ASM_000533 /LENGTH=240 /DNA_ID=CAMNT_0042772189 /DNA_START=222 /DNA_END=944 /DNA_ORIENTATION=+
MEDPIKLLRQSLKANAVLEQRQKLLQAEIVDLQLALVERAQPGAVSELAAQVARLKAENATLICKYKRSKLAAKEAVAGLREALTTERALRKEAQAKLIHFQRHHRDFSDGGESSSGIAEQQQSSSVDDDERYLWQFPTNINFPLTPASSKGKEKEIAGVTTALRHDIESRDHNDRHYPPEDYQEDSQEILDEDDIHLLPPRIHTHHENDNTTFISTNTMRRRQQPQSSVDNNTIEKEEM